jgi:hypothetical protein
VVLLGYSRGLISSRKIEQACRENVVFMALSCGQYPDHSTIAPFVASMKDEILPLFRDVLLVCEEMDLLGGTFFALEHMGTSIKLEDNHSNAGSLSIKSHYRMHVPVHAPYDPSLQRNRNPKASVRTMDKNVFDVQLYQLSGPNTLISLPHTFQSVREEQSGLGREDLGHPYCC